MSYRDRRPKWIAPATHRGESRAVVDSVTLRLQRLGEILGTGDVEALREWRLSQLLALGLLNEKTTIY